MKSVVCLAAFGISVLLALAHAQNCKVTLTGDTDYDYEQYLKCMHPNYKPDRKDPERYARFLRCVAKIANQTGDPKEFERGFTQFCLWTDEEFESIRNDYLRPKILPPGQLTMPSFDSRQKLPPSHCWKEKGGVTPVKQQGICGSCYAFAAAAALEGAYFKKTGKLIDLSPQLYIDCAGNVSVMYRPEWICPGKPKDINNRECIKSVPVLLNQTGSNFGCSGGDSRACWAMHNLTHIPPCTNSCHPYVNQKTKTPQTCTYKKECGTKIRVEGFYNVNNTVEATMHALYHYGPVVCSMDSSKIKQYVGGIIHTESNDCTHAVLIVGYGTEKGVDFWLIKNSWGVEWGEGGYFRLLRKQIRDAIGAANLGDCSVPVISVA